MRALAETAEVAGRAREIGANDGLGMAVGADRNGIGRAEDGGDGNAERDGEMHGPGIVCHAETSGPEDSGELRWRGLAGKIDGLRANGGDASATVAIATRPNERDLQTATGKRLRGFGKAIDAPVFRLPHGARGEHGKFAGGQPMLCNQLACFDLRLRRKIEGLVGRLSVETEQIGNPKTAIECVDPQRPDGEPVSVSEPRAFARSGPAATRRGG